MMTSLSWLPDAAWRGALLLAAAFAVARLLRAQPAAVRHVLWAGAIAGVMAMPLLSFFAPVRVPLDVPRRIVELAPVSRNIPEAVGKARIATAADPDAGDDAATLPTSVETPPPLDAASTLSTEAPRASGMTLAGVATLVWLAGAALVALQFLAGVLAFRRMRSRAEPVEDPEVATLMSACAARIGTQAVPPLLISDTVAMPCTAGWLRPVILLPVESRRWTRERLEVVLLHELGHIHRMDIVPHLLAEMTRILYWFNPLVWLAAARLRAEAESATDERVVHAGARPSDYADHLLGIVLQARKAWHPAPLIPLARRTELEGRILAILESGGRALPSARSASGILVLVAALSLGIASVGSATIVSEPSADPVEAATDSPMTPVMLPDEARDTEQEPPAPSPRASAQGASSTSAVSALAEALRDPVASVRQAAAQALGNARDTVAVQALIEVLRSDPSALVRRSAAWSLGEIKNAAAVPALAEALGRDRDPEVRRNAASALGNIDNPRATPALMQALERDTDVAVRTKAAEALSNIEDAAAIDALIRALDRDTDAGVRRAVIDAIDNLEDARALPSVTRALRDANAEVRRAAAEALGSMEDNDAVPALIAVARDADAEVRYAVLNALGNLSDRRAIETFVGALGDRDVEVRRAAAQGIGNLENIRNAPPALIRAMDDADADVRQSAAHALEHIGDPAAVGALIARITDSSADVRQAVVDALEEFDDPAVTAALRTALKDSNSDVREAAARALGNRTKNR
jgi:HEAT repeat protein/beta-lactamase regulating signal transducer with metallopeptidase domain